MQYSDQCCGMDSREITFWNYASLSCPRISAAHLFTAHFTSHHCRPEWHQLTLECSCSCDLLLGTGEGSWQLLPSWRLIISALQISTLPSTRHKHIEQYKWQIKLDFTLNTVNYKMYPGYRWSVGSYIVPIEIRIMYLVSQYHATLFHHLYCIIQCIVYNVLYRLNWPQSTTGSGRIVALDLK